MTRHAGLFYIAHMTELAQTTGRVVPEFDIGDRMRKAREHAELSQAQIAAEIGVGRTSIIGYETNRMKPSRPVVRAWSFRCGVPYEWICHADTEPCGPKNGVSSQVSGTVNNMHCSPTSIAV